MLVPADATATRWMVREAAAYDGPVYLPVSRLAAPCSMRIIMNSNGEKAKSSAWARNIVVFACGLMVSIALEAAELLAAQGHQRLLQDIHTIKPLDTDFILRDD